MFCPSEKEVGYNSAEDKKGQRKEESSDNSSPILTKSEAESGHASGHDNCQNSEQRHPVVGRTGQDDFVPQPVWKW